MEEALVAVLLYTGMRRGEVSSLLWAAIGEEWIQFEATKSRRERQIPLHPQAALSLRKWRGHCNGSVYVFASTRNPNRPMSEGHLNQIVRDVGELAGVHLHPHLCRHTCAENQGSPALTGSPARGGAPDESRGVSSRQPVVPHRSSAHVR
jgi:integrase